MRKFALAAALLAGTIATPALAQDDATPPGGFHVSGIIGYDAPDGDVDDASGLVYGIGAGYDFNIGRNVFVGPEVELSSSTTDECAAGVDRAGDLLCVSAGRDIYLGARIGTRIGRNARVYVGGGYTNANFEVSYDANLAGSTGDFRVDDELDGFRLKAGAELDLSRNAFVRAEYRYSNYEGDFDRHQLVGAIGFRF
jgi:outer membrane immunogenic protein